jgi:hypothetical protein
MKFMYSVLVLIIATSFSFSQELTKDQIKVLREVEQSLQTVNFLQHQCVIDEDHAEPARRYYLARASSAMGRPVTAEELPSLIEYRESILQKAIGLVTFANFCWVFAGILFAIAILWLSYIYLIYVLSRIPVLVYELAVYTAVFMSLCSGDNWLMFPACILLLGCLSFSFLVHAHDGAVTLGKQVIIENSTLINIICLVVWSVTAYYNTSALIGFCAVLALFYLLGFQIGITPLCYCFGYEKGEYIPRTTAAAFVLLGCTVSYRIIQPNHPELYWFHQAFGDGLLVVGAFVYYISLLITSSKHYMESNRYWLIQIMAIASGVFAVGTGSIYHIQMLQGVGGTFLALYALEKYFEIPWRKVGWAWSLLGLSGGLYWFAGFVSSHPEYFLVK